MFSVVIPLYNKAHIVSRTIASILTQTFQEFEIVIVNDGSTDQSLEAIKPFTADSRIRIIEQANQGVSVARNTGIAHARYEFIAFLDADDEWLPGYLQKMKEAIDAFPNAGIFGSSSWHRNVMTGESDDATLNRYKNKIQIAQYFENPHTMPHISAVVVSKKYFNMLDNGHGFPIGKKTCEDWSCFNRLAFLAPFVYVGFPLSIRNNNVKGQVTHVTPAESDALEHYVVDFYNLTYRFGVNQTHGNPAHLFHIFFRYDLRNRILTKLRDKNYPVLEMLYANIDPDCLNQLSRFELALYKNPKFNLLGKLYLYITKIIWYRHGFPVVGRK